MNGRERKSRFDDDSALLVNGLGSNVVRCQFGMNIFSDGALPKYYRVVSPDEHGNDIDTVAVCIVIIIIIIVVVGNRPPTSVGGGYTYTVLTPSAGGERDRKEPDVFALRGRPGCYS